MVNSRVRVWVSLVLMFTLVGCSSSAPTVKKSSVSPAAISPQGSEYVIRPNDALDIKFFYNPELNESVAVRPDGKISLQLVDDVQAAGLTIPELDEKLTKLYEHELKKPSVTVIAKTFTGQRVYVGGEVITPGIVEYIPGMTALQAVVAAGGARDTAKLANSIVIRKGAQSQPVPVRVNLEETIYEKTDQMVLTPGDVVYVPKSFIAKADLFVSQYIENLLLFRGVSLGFSYDINNGDEFR